MSEHSSMIKPIRGVVPSTGVPGSILAVYPIVFIAGTIIRVVVAGIIVVVQPAPVAPIREQLRDI